jgi:DNA-binding MurR/RpiR family transcriptional regulator
MTIYELAEECFVSTAAISRFTRILAFSSYTEFKQAVEKEIDIVSDYSKKVSSILVPTLTRFAIY